MGTSDFRDRDVWKKARLMTLSVYELTNKIAKGSVAELIAQSDIALGVGYLNSDESKKPTEAGEEVAGMRGGLIKYRENTA